MKDPNVLEAIDLCVNGNPIDKDHELFIYELNCGIEYMLRYLRKPRPAFKKGSHESYSIGEGPEPIIMPKSHKIPPPKNPPPPPFRTIKGSLKLYKSVKIDCLSGNYPGITIKDFFKEIFRNSWFTKFKKWLKYWFNPSKPLKEGGNVPPPRNPLPPPPRTIKGSVKLIVDSAKDYNKQMSNLSMVLGKNTEGNKSIKNLVRWFRKEYEKIPEKYPGDHVVIKEIQKHAVLGLTLNMSLLEAYYFLANNLPKNENNPANTPRHIHRTNIL